MARRCPLIVCFMKPGEATCQFCSTRMMHARRASTQQTVAEVVDSKIINVCMQGLMHVQFALSAPSAGRCISVRRHSRCFIRARQIKGMPCSSLPASDHGANQHASSEATSDAPLYDPTLRSFAAATLSEIDNRCALCPKSSSSGARA